MKKGLFTLMFAAFMAITASVEAQAVSVALLAIDTNPITVDSIPTNGLRIAGSGMFHLKAQHRVSGGQWVDTDTSHFGAGINSFSKGIGMLQASTLYEIRYVAYNATYSDSMTTPSKTATTKPLPQPPSVSFVDTVPGLPRSGIVFAASSVGYPSIVYGINASTGVMMTTTDTFTGNVIDTVFITNAPNQSIASGTLIIVPLASTVSATQSPNTWPAFNAPSYTLADIQSFYADIVLHDSVKLFSWDIPGNGGPSVHTSTVHDSLGNLLQTLPSDLVTASATNTDWVTNLELGTKYIFKRKAVTGGVTQDTAQFFTYTQPAAIPDGIIDSVPTTKREVDVYVTLKTNGRTTGTWNVLRIDSIVLFDNGQVILRRANPIGAQQTGQVHVQLINQAPHTPHTITGYFKSKYGHIVWLDAVTVWTLDADAAATGGFGNEYSYPARITWEGMTYNVPTGSAKFYMTYRGTYPVTTSWVSIPLGTVSGSGAFNTVNVTPLNALTSYEFKYESWNADSVHWVHSDVKVVSTLDKDNSQIGLITIDQQTYTTVEGMVHGSANGTNAEADIKLYEISNGTATLVDAIGFVQVGTDLFSFAYTFTLPREAYYELRSTTREVGNLNPSSLSKYFNNISTGIEDISKSPCEVNNKACYLTLSAADFDTYVRATLPSIAYELNGQELLRGFVPSELQEIYPDRTIITMPMDAEFARTFGGKKEHATSW